MSSTVALRLMPPFSSLVMASRFSTVEVSQVASERMSAASFARCPSVRTAASERSTSALPAMAVSGVRRSWEIERRRLALSCSFLAVTAAHSRCSRAELRARASDASPAMDAAMLASSWPRAASSTSMASTPATTGSEGAPPWEAPASAGSAALS